MRNTNSGELVGKKWEKELGWHRVERWSNIHTQTAHSSVSHLFTAEGRNRVCFCWIIRPIIVGQDRPEELFCLEWWSWIYFLRRSKSCVEQRSCCCTEIATHANSVQLPTAEETGVEHLPDVRLHSICLPIRICKGEEGGKESKGRRDLGSC